MVKELIKVEVERENLQQKWGITIQATRKRRHFKDLKVNVSMIFSRLLFFETLN